MPLRAWSSVSWQRYSAGCASSLFPSCRASRLKSRSSRRPSSKAFPIVRVRRPMDEARAAPSPVDTELMREEKARAAECARRLEILRRLPLVSPVEESVSTESFEVETLELDRAEEINESLAGGPDKRGRRTGHDVEAARPIGHRRGNAPGRPAAGGCCFWPRAECGCPFRDGPPTPFPPRPPRKGEDGWPRPRWPSPN